MSIILVVDDMAAFREPIAMCLQSSGYAVLQAVDGIEALKTARAQTPDLILLDVGMPVMDGLAFLGVKTSDPQLRDIPVILLTAIAEKDCVLRAAKLGVRDYLLKSRFSLKDLLSRVALKLNEQPATPGTAAAGSAKNRQPVPGAPPPPTGFPAAARQVSRRAADNVSAANALASLERLMTRQQVEEQILKCDQIQALSPTVASVMKVTARSGCSLEDVARAIKLDQGLALKVLKLANSVVYSRNTPVDSLDMAVSRVGMANIRQMVTTISVIEQFSGAGLARYLNPMHFWEHSICCGVIAAEVTRVLKGDGADADAAFTMALLHDAGRMALAQQLPEPYLKVLEAAEELRQPLEQVESRMLGVNHAELMELLLARWQFGQHLSRPISGHHLSLQRLCDAAMPHAQETAVLAFSNRLAHAMMIGSSANNTIYPTHELASHLGLADVGIRQIVTEAVEHVGDIKCTLLSRCETDPWPSWLTEMHKCVGRDVRPLYVCTHGAADAYALALERLAEPCDAGEPTVSVLHVPSPRERSEAVELLQQREQEAGIGPSVPLLIIGPANLGKFDASAFDTRRVEHLTSPTPVRQLADVLVRLAAQRSTNRQPAGATIDDSRLARTA